MKDKMIYDIPEWVGKRIHREVILEGRKRG